MPILISIRDVDVLAVCDDNEKRLLRVAEKFKIKNKYSNVDEMLKSTDVDIVDITTPGYTHYEIAKKVLSSGRNVLVEKPATLTAREAEDLDVEANKRNLTLGVCQNYRYSDPVIRFQQVRKSGGIGNIDRIISIQHGSTIFGFPPWFWNEDLSKGILFELGIHSIDLQCYIMGPWKKVLDVSIDYDKSLNIITSILATVKYESGIGVIDLKWHSSSSFMHILVSGSVADAILKFYPDALILQHGDFSPLSECMGELKRIWNFGYDAIRNKYYKKSEKSHRIIIENFIKSVNTGTQPLVPITSIVPTTKLLEEIWAKARLCKESGNV